DRSLVRGDRPLMPAVLAAGRGTVACLEIASERTYVIVGKWDNWDDWGRTGLRARARDADWCAFLDVASGVGAASPCLEAAVGGGRLFADHGCDRRSVGLAARGQGPAFVHAARGARTQPSAGRVIGVGRLTGGQGRDRAGRRPARTFPPAGCATGRGW